MSQVDGQERVEDERVRKLRLVSWVLLGVGFALLLLNAGLQASDPLRGEGAIGWVVYSFLGWGVILRTTAWILGR